MVSQSQLDTPERIFFVDDGVHCDALCKERALESVTEVSQTFTFVPHVPLSDLPMSLSSLIHLWDL